MRNLLFVLLITQCFYLYSFNSLSEAELYAKECLETDRFGNMKDFDFIEKYMPNFVSQFLQEAGICKKSYWNLSGFRKTLSEELTEES